MGCEFQAGQGSLQCTESRTARPGTKAALDPQSPSASTAFTNLCAPQKASFQGAGSRSPFSAWTPLRSPQVPPFSEAPGRGGGGGQPHSSPSLRTSSHLQRVLS